MADNTHQSLPPIRPNTNVSRQTPALMATPAVTTAKMTAKPLSPIMLSSTVSSGRVYNNATSSTRRFPARNLENPQSATIGWILASAEVTDAANLSGARFRFGFTKDVTPRGQRDARSIAFNPDGGLLAGREWGDVKMWSVFEQKEIALLKRNSAAFAYIPDGQLLASGTKDCAITLWSVAKQRQIALLKGEDEGQMHDLAFSPDGRLLASASYIITQKSKSGREIKESTSIAIKLWSVNAKKEVASLTGHGGMVYSVAFSPDGALLASGSWDGAIKLWSIAFSPDGQVLAAGGKLWSVADGQPIGHYGGRGWSAIAFSPDGRLLARCTGKSITLWSVTGQTEIATLSGGEHRLWCVAFSPDGQRIAGGTILSKRYADRDLGQRRMIDVRRNRNPPSSPTPNVTAIMLWLLADQQAVAILEGHIGDVHTVAFSPDGQRLASGGQDGTIKLWFVADGTEIATLTGHRNGVLSVTFSPDGELLASGSWDSTVKLWSLSKMKAIATLKGHVQGVRSVAFSPDGQLLASGEKTVDMHPWAHGGIEGIKLWSVSKGRVLATLAGTGPIAFSPDGSLLAGRVKEGIRLWTVKDIMPR